MIYQVWMHRRTADLFVYGQKYNEVIYNSKLSGRKFLRLYRTREHGKYFIKLGDL